MIIKRNSGEKLGERLRGIRKTKSGKFGAVIRDPFKKKKVWLGSFDNVEEAANAYLSKKIEFEGQLKSRQPTVCQESDHQNMIHKKDSGEKSGETLKGVRRTTPGKYGPVIRDPVNKKQVWLGSFDNAEEADNAHLSMRYALEEQLKARQVVQLQTTECQEFGRINVIRRKDSGEKSRERLRGVRRRNSRKYISEIQDPIRKKRIWLGTFRTAEEASNTYLSKKCEFQEQLKAKQLVQRQPILSQDTVCGDMTYTREMGEKPIEIFSGVTRRKNGRYASAIEDPIKGKMVWFGTFDTFEGAADAYRCKQFEFKARPGVQNICCNEPEIESSHESPSSVPETEALASSCSHNHRSPESETCNANAVEIVKVENNEGCILGLFKPVPSCQGVNLESELFFPILDNNGFLLGEFSKLDDLSICRKEDDYVPTKF